MFQAPIEEIRHTLESNRSVLVVSHVNPDGDAIGAQLAFASYLKHLKKEVFLVRDNDIPFKYRFLPEVDTITELDTYPDDFSVDTALILECPAMRRIGRVKRLLNDNTKIINIDHHADNEGFGDVNWINPGVSSVGEMTYEYFAQVGFPISGNIAQQLYTAILTDTGRFRYSSTSPRTMVIASQLIEAGADPQSICDKIYYNLLPSTMKLTGKVLNSIEFWDDNTICLLMLTNDMLVECGAEASESEGIVDFTLFSEGVLSGALLKENGPRQTKVSFRSRDDINVAAIASRFNGGGHINASGCTIPLPIPEARKEVIKLLREANHGSV